MTTTLRWMIGLFGIATAEAQTPGGSCVPDTRWHDREYTLFEADTMYLIDRRNVGVSYTVIDPSLAIALSPEERQVIVSAEGSDSYVKVDDTIYRDVVCGTTDTGDPIVFREVLGHGQPSVPWAGCAYLFVGDKLLHGASGIGIPYIDGTFGDFNKSQLTLSEEWRKRVDEIIRKHCRPD